MAQLLRANQGQLWSFVLSFAVIAKLWFLQHHSLRNVLFAPDRLGPLTDAVDRHDRLPAVPDGSVGRCRIAVLTKLLYIGTITLNVALVAVMDLVVLRHPAVTGGQTLPDIASTMLNVVLLLVSLV